MKALPAYQYVYIKILNMIVNSNPTGNDPFTDPEVIGDGSAGKDTKEIISLLKRCKKVIELRKEDFPGTFEQGDLVYDEKNSEHGIILGEMPYPDMVDEQMRRGRIRSKTYIILTLTTKSKEEGEGLKTRIRYTNSRFLRGIEDSMKDNSLADLDIFCGHQCIMDCSDDCILRKYKRTRD